MNDKNPAINSMRLYTLAVVCLLVTNVLDVFYTRAIIGTGNAYEFNPIALYLIETFGYIGLLFYKSIFVIGLYFLIPYMSKVAIWVKVLFWMAIVWYIALSIYHIMLWYFIT